MTVSSGADRGPAGASVRPGFDARREGRIAECDGGGPVAGTRFAGRQEFRGRLTGEYVDHGDPPWRWYRLTRLSHKPEGYAWDEVWCEAGSLFVEGEDAL